MLPGERLGVGLQTLKVQCAIRGRPLLVQYLGLQLLALLPQGRGGALALVGWEAGAGGGVRCGQGKVCRVWLGVSAPH